MQLTVPRENCISQIRSCESSPDLEKSNLDLDKVQIFTVLLDERLQTLSEVEESDPNDYCGIAYTRTEGDSENYIAHRSKAQDRVLVRYTLEDPEAAWFREVQTSRNLVLMENSHWGLLPFLI